MPNRLKLLAVEDNDADFIIIQRNLTISDIPDFGIVFTRAVTLEEAVTKTSECFPCAYDMILLDLRLPDSISPEHSLVEMNRSCPDVPIVILSGYDDPDFAVEMVKKGADAFISKNRLSADILVSTLRFTLARTEKRKDTADADKLSPKEILVRLRNIREQRRRLVEQMPQEARDSGRKEQN